MSGFSQMAQQLERLSNINQGLRRNLSVQQERTNTLAKEKAALQADMATLKQEHDQIQERLTQIESEGKANGETGVAVNGLLNNNNESETHNEDHELDDEKENGETAPAINKKDPNRPRFTRQELQDVLNERNQLKEEVLTLKEELAFYKPQYVFFFL